jgi:hypothetical protein
MSAAESGDHVIPDAHVGADEAAAVPPTFTDEQDDSNQSLPSVDNGTASAVCIISLSEYFVSI